MFAISSLNNYRCSTWIEQNKELCKNLNNVALAAIKHMTGENYKLDYCYRQLCNKEPLNTEQILLPLKSPT